MYFVSQKGAILARNQKCRSISKIISPVDSLVNYAVFGAQKKYAMH